MASSISVIFADCPDQVVAKGFTSYSGLYVKQKSQRKIEEIVYQLENKCIWWHKPYRHWWVGECTNFGGSNGLAWLAPDSLCPIQDKVGDWRRAGSDDPLEDSIVEEATFKDLEDLEDFNNANQGLYTLDVLWCQPIKLVQVVSTSEFHLIEQC